MSGRACGKGVLIERTNTTTKMCFRLHQGLLPQTAEFGAKLHHVMFLPHSVNLGTERSTECICGAGLKRMGFGGIGGIAWRLRESVLLAVALR